MNNKNISYKTIQGSSVGEITEKKSRFIADIIHIESEEEAISCIEKIKKENWDARHNCFAYVLGKESDIIRFSDDGEPSGTAGKPILEILQKRELTEILVVVTRYFGGVLLGTGGLVRAYSQATATALDNAKLVTRQLYKKLSINLDYGAVGTIKNILSKEEVILIAENYMESVVMNIGVLPEEMDRIIDKITNVTNGKAKFEYGEEIYL